MNDLLTATAQRNITYLWLFGFFAVVTLQGMGYLKNVPNDIYTLTAVVLFFWFQRTRAQQPALDPATTTTKQTLETVTTPTPEIKS
jgi:hypothetical protein